MAVKPLPPIGVLRQLLDYDPVTGFLTWRKRGPEWFKDDSTRTSGQVCHWWNARYAGKRAFTARDKRGYLQGSINGTAYLANRICWAMAHGVEPKGQVDHANRDKGDNSELNLRDATQSQNGYNGAPVPNATGHRGVKRVGGKWTASIRVCRKRHHLGTFDSPEKAALAYQDAAVKFHGDFRHRV